MVNGRHLQLIQITDQIDMGSVHRSVATLRFIGDDLDPDEVTALLHSPPTQAYRKDEQIIGSNGRMRIASTGSWRLHATDSKPEDLNAQIAEILGRLTPDLHIWTHLSSRYRLDLFCGLFLNSPNEGLCLSPQSLRALGERGIELGLDIYSGAND